MLRQFDAFRGESVDVGSLDGVIAETSKVAVSQIVCQQDDDVG